MSEEGDYWRSIAKKSEGVRFPMIAITPDSGPDEIPVQDMAKILYMISEMCRKISEKTSVGFVVDIVNSEKIEPQCKMSPDGYHETMEVSYHPSGKSPINSCIHCGEISKITRKTKKEIQEHFEKMQEEIKSPY